MKYKLTYRARVDLLQIWNYLAESSFDAADKVATSLRDEMRGLAEMPGQGTFSQGHQHAAVEMLVRPLLPDRL